MKKVFIIVFVLLLDACGDSGVSNNRLAVDNINVAGKKAPELKKVIDEYKDDKEKLKSSEFLIANMNYKYTLAMSNESQYVSILDSISQLNDPIGWDPYFGIPNFIRTKGWEIY